MAIQAITSLVIQQFLRFLAAGLLGLLVDMALLYLLAPWLGWYTARFFSFIGAATFTWLINRHYTFRSNKSFKSIPLWKEYVCYLLSMTVGGSINYVVFLSVLHYIKHPYSPMLGVVAGSGCGLIFNFAAARYAVFRSRESSS